MDKTNYEELKRRADIVDGFCINENMCKGKRKDNGEWIYGYLVVRNVGVDKQSYRIVNFNVSPNPEGFVIDPDTLCRCTGIRDKNAKLIFEHDIIKTQEIYDRPHSSRRKGKEFFGVVTKNTFHHNTCKQDYDCKWHVKINDEEFGPKYGCYDWSIFFKSEIVGNEFGNY